MNNFLPVGTVVKIKEKKEKLIIIGRNILINDKTYDYSCVIYPYGYYQELELIYCNDIDVEEVIFMGNINY